MDIIKVSANSRTSAVAGAIAGVIRENKHAEVQAIGAGAVNQAVKALVLATSYLKNDGIDVVCMPEFVDVQIDDKVRTAIKLVVEPRMDAVPALGACFVVPDFRNLGASGFLPVLPAAALVREKERGELIVIGRRS